MFHSIQVEREHREERAKRKERSMTEVLLEALVWLWCSRFILSPNVKQVLSLNRAWGGYICDCVEGQESEASRGQKASCACSHGCFKLGM